MLTYKQRTTAYVLLRNSTAPTPRKHALVTRAAAEGLDTRTIASHIGLSMRQVQRIVAALVK